MTRSCETCQSSFAPRERDVKRGRGRFCSPACQRKAAARRGGAARPQTGARNPNWKGGVTPRGVVASTQAFRQKNPEKYRAWLVVQAALRRGELSRPDRCSICGSECKPESHHADYTKPRDVEWVCRSCHVMLNALDAAA